MSKSVLLTSFLAISFVNYFACGDTSDFTISEAYSLFKESGFSASSISQTLQELCKNSDKDSLMIGMKIQFFPIQDSINHLKEVQKRPRNCADLFNLGDKKSGVRTVYPFTCCENKPVSVYCDQTTDGGGWTVIQHRDALPQRENFFRKWIEYQLGFGNLTGEFWLGLDNIHALVKDTLMELRVDLEDYEGEKRWAKYEHFYVGNTTQKYLLDLGEYSGNAGDSLRIHNDQKFSTKDQDNDRYLGGNCSKNFRGAWWYIDCHDVNLNGYQYEGKHNSMGDGIHWKRFRGEDYSLKVTSLSLRPKFRT